ncbi:MAG: tetratricopeptide repeat protein [Bacteroidia bacterium]|nr:tetratricopeptide repeat protein [Bacteroidia bacterium]
MKAKQKIIRNQKNIPGIQTDKEMKGLSKNWLGISIALLAFVLYSQSIGFQYTLDDKPVTVDNNIVTQGIKGIPKILVTDYWYGCKDGLRVPQYRPASLIMFAIEYQLFPGNPHINHLINVLLYSLTCWILFLFLARLFHSKYLIYSFIGCLLFVIHPIHTEVVNSVKSRDEILCFLFALLCLFWIMQYMDTRKSVFLLLSSLSFTGSLFSKETGVAFIMIIPLLLYCFTQARRKDYIKISFIFAAITVAFLLIRYQFVRSVPSNLMNSEIQNTLNIAPDFLSEKTTAFFILLRYILLLIVPHPLSYDYSYSQIKIHQLSDPGAILGLLVYLAIFIIGIMNLRKNKIIAFALFFYLITLAPVSNIFILIGSTMAERFLYTPSMGFCMILIFLMIKLNNADIPKNKQLTPGLWMKSNLVMCTILLIIVGLFTVKTFIRSRNWKNDAELFGHDVRIAENSARAQFNWGSALLNEMYPDEKNPGKKREINEQAINAFNKAIQIFDKGTVYYYLLGQAYLNNADYDKAIRNYEIYRKNKKNPEMEFYNNLAYLYLQTKQYNKSIEVSDIVLAKKPDSKEALINKGVALMNSENYSDSKILFEKVLKMDPENALAICNMGCDYANLKDYKTSQEYFKKSLELDSTNSNIYYYIGLNYQNMGDLLNAGKYFDKANKLKARQ